ncbi:MAG: magnesium transporter CorA family protein [Bacteroidaceae bacterium]|nr:magnesium transporter CorA family protein [Bacteroidaceae bacterium]
MRAFWRIKPQIEALEKWEPNCWIQMTCPTEEEADYLVNELQMPDYFLSDIADVDERPRVETEEGWTMIILRVPYMNPTKESSRSPYTTVPLGIILKKDICITVCYYITKMMNDFLSHYQRKGKGLTDAVDMTFRLFLSSSVWYLKFLKKINYEIEEAKHDLDKSIDNEDLINLSYLQNSLTYFMNSIRGNETLLAQVKFKLPVDELDAELIEDVNIEMKQARESAYIYSNVLESAVNTYASVINNNMNTVMRLMTSVSIVLMFPTLIASLYGMNLKNGLEDNSLGFCIVLGFSLLVSATIIWLFRRKRWL